MSPTLRSLALAVVLLSISRNNAWAAADKDPEAMILDGIALRRAGKDDRALEVFKRAYALAPSPRAAGQLGLCEQSLGLWVPAEVHLNEALGSRTDRWVAKNRSVLQASLESVATHLATVEFRGGPVGAQVRLDGEIVGAFPLSRPVRSSQGKADSKVRRPGASDGHPNSRDDPCHL